MSRAATDQQPYTKTPGEEPLPGYRLIEPLGRGGFGEVWKCVAPGGLHKAVKFVAGDLEDSRREDTSLQQELDAFQQIKAIRHPFLLTLERVELVNGELVMVMELADRHLLDRYDECRAQGLPGVPRDELIGYLADAAEALDVIGTRHGLQHLDVKPANLFLIDNHVKVGDYGLVARLEKGQPAPGAAKPTRGLTPRYVAPEVVEGQVDQRSDQYSLALVYQEMLTGVFPFRAKSAAHMLLLHATGAPDLSPLPTPDRPAVAKALAKKPADRFNSCTDFVAFLASLTPAPARPSGSVGSAAIRRLTKSPEYPTPRVATQPTLKGPTPPLPPLTAPGSTPGLNLGPASGSVPVPAPVPRPTARPAPRPDCGEPGMVELIASQVPPPGSTMAALQLSGGHATSSGTVTHLDRIWSVVTAARLAGEGEDAASSPPAQELAAAVVRAAAGGVPPRFSGDPVRRPDGSWSARLVLKPVSAVVRLKLQMLAEQCGAELVENGPDRFALRLYAGGGVWGKWSGKKSGLEVLVRVPPGGQAIGEAEFVGRVFGTPDAAFLRSADEYLTKILDEARRQLQNTDDRRKSPRMPCDFPMRVFPITSEGGVFPPVPARCRDVSAEGVRLLAERPVEGRYCFVGFDKVPEAAGWCLLTRLLRKHPVDGGYELAGRFRMDL